MSVSRMTPRAAGTHRYGASDGHRDARPGPLRIAEGARRGNCPTLHAPMSARTRRNLALALAIVLELVVGVGTLSVRHGRTVTSGHGPSTTAAPDTSVGGTLAVESTTTTKAASTPSGPVRVSPAPGSVQVSWDRVPGSVRLYSVEATDQATGYSGTVFAC